MKYIYYFFKAIAKWFYLQFKIIEAFTFHLEDRKQYHVVEDDEKWYKIVSRKSLEHHNKIAKKSNQFRHLTMKDIHDMAIYSTPLKGKTNK